ncbi:MAG: ABC transporter permease [Bacillota bacterium]
MTTRKRIPDFLWVFILLAAALIVMGIVSPGTLTARHLMDLMRQAAPLGVAAAGQTLLLMSGNIDLSFGAQITLCNLVLSTVMAAGRDPGTILPAVGLATALGLLVGVTNGYAVAKLKIPAFVATLATGLLIQGGYLIYTRGAPAGSIAPEFRVIAEGWIGGIVPWSVVIWAAASVLLSLLVHNSKFGRQMMAVGGNPKASHLSGLSVERTTIGVYAVGSLFAVLAGCLISAYIGLASTGVGEPYTLNSIASSVIGGTPFSGGEGTMAGSFGGALIMTVIQAILTGLNTGDAGKMISQGLVIIVMVSIYQRRAK